MRHSYVFAMAGFVATGGCATQHEQLYPAGGDTFSIRRLVAREREPIVCGGTPDERFRCLTGALQKRAGGKDRSGTLTVVGETGPARTMVNGDAAEQSRFGIGSLSKMVLAAALLSVTDESHVDLDAPLERIVPELAGTREVDVGDVTLHQLLTHTAGIPSLVDCAVPDDLHALLLSRRGKPLWSPPGAVYNYSNLGYALVAAVMEQVARAPFESIVRDRVLRPLGITGVSYDEVGEPLRSESRRPWPGDPWCRAQEPSGGLQMDVGELGTLVRAMMLPERSPLGARTVARMTTPYVRTDDFLGEMYGYGIGMTSHDGLQVLFHGGSLLHSAGFVAWLPQRRWGAAALVSAPIIPVTPVYDSLSTLLDLSPRWLPTPSRPPEGWQRYEGTYVDPTGTLGRVRVAVEGDHLALWYVDGPPPLKPTSFAFATGRAGSDRARYIVTAVGVGARGKSEDR